MQISNGRLQGTSWNNYQYGGGLRLNNCTTTIVDCKITDNDVSHCMGVGIYAQSGSLVIEDSVVSDNVHDSGSRGWGAGLHVNGTDLTVRNVTFENNRILGQTTHAARGGAIYADGGELWIEASQFFKNYLTGNNADRSGGAVYVANATSLTITNCVFEGNGQLSTTTAGGTLHVASSASTLISGTRFNQNAIHGHVANVALTVAWSQPVRRGGDDLFLNVAGPVTIENSEITGGMHRGIYKTGAGTLTLRNSLVGHQGGHGVDIDNGTATFLNSTIAGNGGWGVQSMQDITMTDSIVWDNVDGLSVGGGSVVTYSCIQGGYAGTGNIDDDPRFITGYYLARDGLPFQETDSPCIAQGSATAEALGLENLTTRTDGATASGAVDMGYHHSGGVSGLDNLVLHVDVHNGNDANNGWTSGTSLETLGAALEKAIAGTVIHVATGTYSEASGETFPLYMNTYGVTLRGTDEVNTIIQGNSSDSVIRASGSGPITLERLTLRDGQGREGAALFLDACHARIVHCIIRNNAISGQVTTGAITLYSGRTEIRDSVIRNHLRTSQTLGGALFAFYNTLVLRDTHFLDNRISHNQGVAFGGAMAIEGGVVMAEGCTFEGNRAQHRGGAIYVRNEGTPHVTLLNCFFTEQSASAGEGSAIAFRANNGTMLITDCVFSNNVHTAATHDIQISGGEISLNRTLLTAGPASAIQQSGASSALGITNSLIYGYAASGMSVAAGGSSIASTTVADNGGWGLDFSGTDMVVENTILWDNASGGINNDASGSSLIRYTLSQEVHAGDENKSGENPLFEDASEGNYRLGDGSPALNAGLQLAWMSGNLDLDGNRRVSGSGPDLGAYERPGAPGTVFLFH